MLGLLAGLLVLAACSSSEAPTSVAADVRSTTLDRASACAGQFVAHELDHVTASRGPVAAMVDGTGSGVLVEDLDGDGLDDIVLPNLSGETTLLWNEGDLEFDRAVLDTGRFRQAAAADLQGDGHVDVVLTTGVGPPVVYTNDGARGFARGELDGVRAIAYSVGLGDLEGDGDVDVVSGSYNAELTANRDSRALLQVDTGVTVHRAAKAGFESEQLSVSAQALVSQIVDVDGDGRSDVLIGNDLSTPDYLWLGDGPDLVPTELFATTTLSTMSFDVADLDGDGHTDLVATDMMPMDDDPGTVHAWEPVMEDVDAAMIDDVQRPANAVQTWRADGFVEQADDLGVAATGWSWSGLAGDLDNDGRQDLYVVNGMEAAGLFDHLPEAELVEPNQAFRNVGGAYEPAPAWGLDSELGGRGLAQADLDRDGDLDMVVSNLNGPALLFENQICGNRAVVVDVQWPAAANTTALGATVRLARGDDQQVRLITAARGYLSGSPTVAHFGVGDDDRIATVEVQWPDGATTVVEDVAPGSHVTLTRSTPPVAR